MKKIGIDARLINQTGIGVYLQNLLSFLPETSKFVFYIYLLEKDFYEKKFLQKNFLKRKANFRWHTASEQIGFLKLLLSDNLDLVHFPYFSSPLFYWKKFIITLHDLTPLFFKTGKASSKFYPIYYLKHFFYKINLKNQVKNSKAIITPSHYVKDQLITVFGKKIKNLEKKIYPIYEGVDEELKITQPNNKLKKKFQFPFFIYVGNFYPHKNVERLITAFKNEKFPPLILIGPKDFFALKLKDFVSKNKLDKKIFFFLTPKKEDLVFFYKNALALIFPSLSEGFGLPLLEACFFNCPIIASDIPVFNEILKGKFIKFDPYNVEDIKNKIKFFLLHQPKYSYQKILTKYSFKRMSKKTFFLYKKILET